MKKLAPKSLLIFSIFTILNGCSYVTEDISGSKKQTVPSPGIVSSNQNQKTSTIKNDSIIGASKKEAHSNQPKSSPHKELVRSISNKPSKPSLQLAANPKDLTVLVNKNVMLPIGFVPQSLVFPKIPFLVRTTTEKRQMHKEAASKLEAMYAAAKKDNIYFIGVSAYRSYATQKILFDYYVNRDGYTKARTYSALPGTSEHETGLAIDVTGKDGTCAAMDCFGDKKEAIWLAKHGHEFGFIIRYPKGKESITGYKYEPWHIRYVGVEVAKVIFQKGITLEEYVNV